MMMMMMVMVVGDEYVVSKQLLVTEYNTQSWRMPLLTRENREKMKKKAKNNL